MPLNRWRYRLAAACTIASLVAATSSMAATASGDGVSKGTASATGKDDVDEAAPAAVRAAGGAGSGTLQEVVADEHNGGRHSWAYIPDNPTLSTSALTPSPELAAATRNGPVRIGAASPDATATAASSDVNSRVSAVPAVHTIDLSVVDNLGTLTITDTEVRAAAAAAAAYWQREASGRIAGIAVKPTITRFSTALPPGPAACAGDAWSTLRDEAQAATPPGDAARHLVIVVPPSCGPTWGGLGSLGTAGSFDGGFILAQGMSALPGILAHELGHNFGLEHAAATNPTDGTVEEYGNPYEVMGRATGAPGIPALGPVLRDHLGILDPAEIATMTPTNPSCASTATYVLAPRSAASGIRTLRLPTAAADARPASVSFRSGTLSDAGSQYASQAASRTGPGVVIDAPRNVTGSLLFKTALERASLSTDDDSVRVGPYRVRLVQIAEDRSSAVVEVDYDPGTACRTGPTPSAWRPLKAGDVRIGVKGRNRPRLTAYLPRTAGATIDYLWLERRIRPGIGVKPWKTLSRKRSVPLLSLREDVARRLVAGLRVRKGWAPQVWVSISVPQTDSLGRTWTARSSVKVVVQRVPVKS